MFSEDVEESVTRHIHRVQGESKEGSQGKLVQERESRKKISFCIS